MSSTPVRRPSPVARRRPTTAGWIALIVFGLLTGLGLLGAVFVVGTYAALANGLPPTSRLEEFALAEESIVYDRTGEIELARFGEFRRELVAFDDIPAVVLDATTAVEDKSFWTNPGFDPAAIIASGIDALRGNPRGASTITQQLVRQRLLDPELVQSKGRTVERKLKEIIQSIRVTRAYPGDDGKERIISAYLNQNFYGNNSYGVKAAAQGYFGKSLDELTLAEAAILAALPQSPSSYDLVRNAIALEDGSLVVPSDTDIVHRRNQVLDLMAQDRTPLSGDEYTAADFEAAKRERVVLAPQADEPWIASHFVWALRTELATQICGEEAQTCPELERGGFRITSTLDTRLQGIAEKWVKAATIVPRAEDPEAAAAALGLPYADWIARLRDKDLNNGALVALDYETGELVAYVGSADYAAETGNPKFQPKFDVVGSGWRQPGSAFKPFNYLTGIDDRTMTAATMLMDVGTDFGGEYTPTNADNLERGPVRVRSALQFSLNIPSVKAMAVNGADHVFARARDFGMRFRTETTDAGLALALGVAEVRPVDLVTAYGTLANGGRYTGHTTILAVRDGAGNDVTPPHERPAGEQVASAEAAHIVTDILAGNTNPGINPFWGRFAIAASDTRRPATLKTGTNNDAKDLNAYGFIAPPTADGRAGGEHALAVGAWNGNSDNTVVSTPDRPVFSIDVTTFVWQGFMAEATASWAVNDFARPAGLVVAPVDPWTGLRPSTGGPAVSELFLAGTEPQASVGADGGVCGEGILAASFEARYPAWLAADRDWIARAQQGPGVRGGPDGNRTSYFYNNGFQPYGASWGPLLGGGACASPTPPPTCIPWPTPDASGVVPSLVIPSPSGSEIPPVPCVTPEPSPSESPSASPSESPSLEPTPPPTEPPTAPPTPPGPPSAPPGQQTPAPTPTPTPTPTLTSPSPSP
jgi:peptidoglycan glycosyltransferase